VRLFQITPPWNNTGDNPYPWVDSADGLFEPADIFRLQPLVQDWSVPHLITSASSPNLDAYCCPSGLYLFSPMARDVLAPAIDNSAEWLPAEIDGLGEFYILHPLRSCSLGPAAQFVRNPVSGNITQIEKYDFQETELQTAAIFYPAQTPGSAAHAVGSCFRALISTEPSALLWNRAGLRGVRFEPLANAVE